MGHEAMDASPDGLRQMARYYASHGVTGFLATTWTASGERILAAVQAAAQYYWADPGRRRPARRPPGRSLSQPGEMRRAGHAHDPPRRARMKRCSSWMQVRCACWRWRPNSLKTCG